MRTISTGLYVIFTDGLMYLMRNSGRYLVYAFKYLLPLAFFAGFTLLVLREVWWLILVSDTKYRNEDAWVAGILNSILVLVILGIVSHHVGRNALRKRR